MQRHFRSPFEAMVFERTAGRFTLPSLTLSSSVYKWVQDLYPSRPSQYQGVVVSREKEAQGVIPVRSELRNYERKFKTESLFEVVVMYLMNGLSNSSDKKRGTELLHYLMYIVPEADKLHVVDLDAHAGYFERIQAVRVIFDGIDYKFRVMVKGSKTEGWVDICPRLRSRFQGVVAEVLKQLVPVNENIDVSDCWVPLVTGFRSHLIDELQRQSGATREKINDWVLKVEHIQWEEPTYGAGDVIHRNLLDDKELRVIVQQPGDMNEHKIRVLQRRPFIISYWADNYLEFDNYKVARAFNGLVGYGEYLEDRSDNHYSGVGTNNFFLQSDDDVPDKKWLWHDLPHGTTGTLAVTLDRSNVLEAVVKEGVVWLTPDFYRMVHRRQEKTIENVETSTIEAVKAAIENVEGFDTVVYTAEWWVQTVTDLKAYARELLGDLFQSVSGPLGTGDREGDGLLHAGILNSLVTSFWDSVELRFREYGADWGILWESIPERGKIEKRVMYMFSVGIHLERETWLLDLHTKLIEFDTLDNLQMVYRSETWDTDHVWDTSHQHQQQNGHQKSGEGRSKRSLAHIAVKNNSSQAVVYKDKAIKTDALGFTRSARMNGIPCFPYMCAVSEQVLNTYCDRITSSDEDLFRDEDYFISSCDLTSILRTTQTVLRGFSTFIDSFSSVEDEQDTLISTTRSPYAAYGSYWVLESENGLYGCPVNKKTVGKRNINCDDVRVFAEVLNNLVANPGIWNLLSPIPKNRKDDSVDKFVPQIANSGLINSGRASRDHPKVGSKPDSWAEIAAYTYNKLRLGIMDQPEMNNARMYVNEILNNTSRLNPKTAHTSFVAFMDQIYTEYSFRESFEDPSRFLESEFEPYTRQDETEPERSVEQDILKQAGDLVGFLLANCENADRTTELIPTQQQVYAFWALRGLGIELPESKPRKLFYILFGETIARLIIDLESSPILRDNDVQELQLAANRLIAKQLKEQLKPFLCNLTARFFDCSLHRYLVDQLTPTQKRHKRALITQVGPRWPGGYDGRFNNIYNFLEIAILKLRNTPVTKRHGIDAWKRVSSAATAAKMTMLVDEKTEPIETDEYGETDEDYAFIVFEPYVALHYRIAHFIQIEPAPHSSYTTQVEHFWENRMLLMRICEEQLHLIERHSDKNGDFKGSKSWELLFDTFVFHRQVLAEMKEPRKS